MRISPDAIPCLFLRNYLPLLSLLTLCSTAAAAESPRLRTQLVDWQFAEDASPATSSSVPLPPQTADWKPVATPHVFRQSGLPDDTAGWYRQTIRPRADERGRSFYLMLEGAASVKDVFVNGWHIGQHKGAFSRSCFDLTPKLKWGEDNTLEVRVSNRESEAQNCFSRSTLYYVNGGMFRPAWLVKTGAVHLFPDLGSSGVYLTPKNITPASGDLEARAVVKNALAKPAAVTVRFFVQDSKGAACAQFEKSQTIPAGEAATLKAGTTIANPRLWDVGQPNLYSVRVEVSVEGTVTDELVEHTGFGRSSGKANVFISMVGKCSSAE